MFEKFEFRMSSPEYAPLGTPTQKRRHPIARGRQKCVGCGYAGPLNSGAHAEEHRIVNAKAIALVSP